MVRMSSYTSEERLEVALLRHCLDDGGQRQDDTFDGDVDYATCHKLVELTVAARFDEVLYEAIAHGIINTEVTSDLAGSILRADYLITNDERIKHVRQITVLCAGVACLQLFVQNNWLGPLTDVCPQALLPGLRERYVTDTLCMDGEVILSCLRYPGYLQLARLIVLDGCDRLDGTLTADWWALRCVQVHQAVLPLASATLKHLAVQHIDKLNKHELLVNTAYLDLALQFHLEAGHCLYSYYEPRQAKQHFHQAESLSGLHVELTGQLGKRTKFQQKEISQLVLKVTRLDAEQPWDLPASDKLPTNVRMDDDTLLEQIELSDNKDLLTSMTGVQQALILGLCYRHRKNMEGSGKIIQEECLAYVNGALHQGQSWSVQTSALLMRAHWENESTRLIQRSMLQLEEIVAQTKRPDPGPEVRLPLVYCCKLPPLWQIQQQLAMLYEKLGAISGALEVYQRIEAWDDVIKCYTNLGKKEKANTLIREQLALKETPLLWCYLGDVHGDQQYYHKAWELSKGKFSKAQRSLGYLHLHNKNFKESLACFEKSLKINTLQTGVWFSYGCAALACLNYEVSARAFRRCVDLDPDNFQAWNNLATSYIRSNQKSRAFTVLQEALKCEFENWQLWDNYMLVCIDIGEFQECIRAYHRILDLKEKHADVEVLQILAQALKRNLPDAHGAPTLNIKANILQLFGRITSKITSNADIWKSYAQAKSCGDTEQTDQEMALQYMQKAHRCTTQNPSWEKEVEKCKNVLNQSIELAKTYIKCSESMNDGNQACQILAAAKLMIKGVLSNIQRQQHKSPSDTLDPDVQHLYGLLELQLADILKTIEDRKTPMSV